MSPREEELEAENAWLKDRLAAVTGRHLATELRTLLGITPKAARILALLLTRPGPTSTGLIWDEVLADATGDGPESTVIKCHVSRTRMRLREIGAPEGIECVFDCGYRLTPELRAWLQGIVQPQAVAA